MTPSDIKLIRTTLDLTQVEFANLIGSHPITVSKWERGESDVTPHFLRLFEAALRRRESLPFAGLKSYMKSHGPLFAYSKFVTIISHP